MYKRQVQGPSSASKLVNDLAFGGYNKAFAPNRTGYDWLSADSENVDRYIADPLCEMCIRDRPGAVFSG